jgi:hypothetical protein
MSLRVRHFANSDPTAPLEPKSFPFIWTKGEGRIYVRVQKEAAIISREIRDAENPYLDVTIHPANEFGRHSEVRTSNAEAWQNRLEPCQLITLSNG